MLALPPLLLATLVQAVIETAIEKINEIGYDFECWLENQKERLDEWLSKLTGE